MDIPEEHVEELINDFANGVRTGLDMKGLGNQETDDCIAFWRKEIIRRLKTKNQ